MAAVKPIRAEEDYEAALERVSELMDTLSGPQGQIEDPNHPDRIELDVLTDLVQLYEARHYPIDPPSPIGAIEYEMDRRGLTPRDLIPIIGSRSKVSEILSGKREITMPMARALHQHLNIPAEILLRDPAADSADPLSSMDPQKFPLKEMTKRGWIPKVPASEMKHYARELIQGLSERAGGQNIALAPLYRKNDHRRINAKTNSYALTAWCLQTLAMANKRDAASSYEPGSITPDFLRQVAKLSASQSGPVLAQTLLAKRGIPLIILPHLPRTHLDGAALRAADGRPVIGLTLRYDRIDNFWFCLLHELAHIGLHMDDGCDIFTDDHSLRSSQGAAPDSKESEADDLAEEALIPKATWEEHPVSYNPSPMNVMALAQDLGIQPAIVAGRVRYQRKNYRLLSQFVGTSQVRKQFDQSQ